MSYQVLNLRPMHSGGNGDLFVGQRTDNGATVVVKYLREYWMPHARKAFAREVHILERMIHGLVPLSFANLTAKRPYYVMPYLKGGTLSKWAGRLTDDQLHTIAAELAHTLANLHAAYEAHGDVKPDNILVTRDGHLQVADPLGNGTVFTILFSENHGGTPGYWAPEICAGGSISRAGDVYSFGATLYHLLTGRRPQDGERLDPSAEGYRNAPRIREIIGACCQFEPGARPTMQQVPRILHGEKWADIQASQKQCQQLVTAACVFGCLALLVGAVLADR